MPTAAEDEIGWKLVEEMSAKGAELLMPAFCQYHGRYGRLSVQIDPRFYRDARRILATEWAKYGIRVNGIAPTFTRMPLVDRYLNDPDFYNGLVARIPMGRVCETADLVGIGVFLASKASAFITGQNIFVDGGATACQ